MNGKAIFAPVLMFLGWYSEKLFKQDISKMVIGCIDKLTDISDQVLIKHLKEVKRISLHLMFNFLVCFGYQYFGEFVVDSL